MAKLDVLWCDSVARRNTKSVDTVKPLAPLPHESIIHDTIACMEALQHPSPQYSLFNNLETLNKETQDRTMQEHIHQQALVGITAALILCKRIDSRIPQSLALSWTSYVHSNTAVTLPKCTSEALISEPEPVNSLGFTRSSEGLSHSTAAAATGHGHASAHIPSMPAHHTPAAAAAALARVRRVLTRAAAAAATATAQVQCRLLLLLLVSLQRAPTCARGCHYTPAAHPSCHPVGDSEQHPSCSATSWLHGREGGGTMVWMGGWGRGCCHT